MSTDFLFFLTPRMRPQPPKTTTTSNIAVTTIIAIIQGSMPVARKEDQVT